VVKVYKGAVDSMGKWMKIYDDAIAKGAPEWFFILVEGDGPGVLRCRRFSSKGDEWQTVYEMPARFKSRDEEKAGISMLFKVLDGFVPSLKRKMGPGRF
jgi:hypothetical protein